MIDLEVAVYPLADELLTDIPYELLGHRQGDIRLHQSELELVEQVVKDALLEPPARIASHLRDVLYRLRLGLGGGLREHLLESLEHDL
ncbi:MAG: hypothetical protein MUE55_04705 [Thermoplasmata archaeon]|nr:hypothetical protein [Thermoplasmata archaeon]